MRTTDTTATSAHAEAPGALGVHITATAISPAVTQYPNGAPTGSK